MSVIQQGWTFLLTQSNAINGWIQSMSNSVTVTQRHVFAVRWVGPRLVHEAVGPALQSVQSSRPGQRHRKVGDQRMIDALQLPLMLIALIPHSLRWLQPKVACRCQINTALFVGDGLKTYCAPSIPSTHSCWIRHIEMVICHPTISRCHPCGNGSCDLDQNASIAVYFPGFWI